MINKDIYLTLISDLSCADQNRPTFHKAKINLNSSLPVADSRWGSWGYDPPRTKSNFLQILFISDW